MTGPELVFGSLFIVSLSLTNKVIWPQLKYIISITMAWPILMLAEHVVSALISEKPARVL